MKERASRETNSREEITLFRPCRNPLHEADLAAISLVIKTHCVHLRPGVDHIHVVRFNQTYRRAPCAPIQAPCLAASTT